MEANQSHLNLSFLVKMEKFSSLNIPVKIHFKGKRLVTQVCQKSHEIFLEFYNYTELFTEELFNESTLPKPAISNFRNLISSVNQNQVTEPLPTWSENLDSIQLTSRNVNQISRFMRKIIYQLAHQDNENCVVSKTYSTY